MHFVIMKYDLSKGTKRTKKFRLKEFGPDLVVFVEGNLTEK